MGITKDELVKDVLNMLARDIYEINKAHGWWEDADQKNKGEVIALIHSEASELLEAIRHGNPPSDHISQFSGAEEELADIIIRCLDMGRGFGYDVAGAVSAKIAFNNNRPYKHGGKAF